MTNVKKWIDKMINIKLVLLLFILLSFICIDKPGLYMDAVNPDYMGLHILNPDNVRVWAFSDNFIATKIEGNTAYSDFPILNSLYGTCFGAYIMLIWSLFFGYGVCSIRALHILYSVVILWGVYSLLKNALGCNEKISSIAALVLALEPSFVFCSKTQFYLQIFPHIFFLFGVVLLLKTVTDESNNIKLLLSGVLFGLSACSYFVFAFYFVGVFFTYLFLLIQRKRSWLKQSLRFILGFLIGYIPYIYGHVSIMITQGIRGWIEALKGLDTYGLSDGARASFTERMVHVVDSIGNIAGGATIIQMMTGHNMGYAYGKVIATLYLFFVFVGIGLLFRKRKTISESNALIVLMAMISAFIFHVLLALVVGNALGYQHFVMLLPIMLITIIIVLEELINSDFSAHQRKVCFSNIASIFMLVVLIISFDKDIEGYHVIEETGGSGYYSKVINDISYYLDGTVTLEDTIISPQWGYWMQIACITNGKRELWIDTDPSTLQWRIDNNSKSGRYYVIIDNHTDSGMITGLMQANGFKLRKEQQFNDYEERLSPTVCVFEREE